jgi:CspA family cold shock protein
VKNAIYGGDFLNKGTVSRWFDFKGYGFIDVDGNDKDVFVHNSDVKGIHSIRQGEKVEFDIIETDKGHKAVNVQVISET